MNLRGERERERERERFSFKKEGQKRKYAKFNLVFWLVNIISSNREVSVVYFENLLRFKYNSKQVSV